MKPQHFRISFVLFLSLFSLLSFGQKLSLITNNKITWKVITTPLRFLDSSRIEVSQTFIQVELPESVRTKLIKLNREEWLSLLSDENTDWAANLCLYDIHKKEPISFDPLGQRASWTKCCKKNDIDYWRKKLIDNQ